MAKPNYSFEKRQRELAKKRKKEEKAQRKSSGASTAGEQGAPATNETEDAALAPATPTEANKP